MTLERIPSEINGVRIDKADCVNDFVDPKVIEALFYCIHPVMGPKPEHRLTTIYISSANDSHSPPSRHAQAKAIDVSRINGLRMSTNPRDTSELVEIMQRIFESYEHRRENYGPKTLKKLGRDRTLELSDSFKRSHLTHIHWSVN